MKEIDSLFNKNTGKFLRWSNILRAYVKFWVSIDPDKYEFMYKKDIEEKEILSFYEILGSIDPEKEYESFQKIMSSKTSLFRYPEFKNSVSESDLLSTSIAIFVKDFNVKFLPLFKSLLEKLKKIAIEYKDLPQIGRTHGVHAEPTSFGHRFAVLYSDLEKYYELIWSSRKNLEIVCIDVLKFRFPKYFLRLQNFIANEFDLFSGGNFGILSWTAYVDYLGTLNSVVQLINKSVLDLQLLNSVEIGEVSISENIFVIDLLSKKVNSYYEFLISMKTSFNSDTLFFLRSFEDYVYKISEATFRCVDLFFKNLDTLRVNSSRIADNLRLLNKSIYSQFVMLYLIKKTSFPRHEVMEDVRNAFEKSSSQGFTFEELMSAQHKYHGLVSKEDFENLFRPMNFLQNIDSVYERIFGTDKKFKECKEVIWEYCEIQYRLDKLSERLNYSYLTEREPISIISFAEKSLVFLGQLLPRLNFDVILNTFGNIREDMDISEINLSIDHVQSRRLLLVDFAVTEKSNLDLFIRKLHEKYEYVRDVKVCSFLKMDDSDIDFFAIKCDYDDFYVGFGKNNGIEKSFRNLPFIGTLL